MPTAEHTRHNPGRDEQPEQHADFESDHGAARGRDTASGISHSAAGDSNSPAVHTDATARRHALTVTE